MMKCLTYFLFWLLACAAACAQSVLDLSNTPKASVFPPPPASHIHDPDKVLERNPQAAKAISDALRSLDENHQYKIYLYVTSVFLTSTSQECAETARRAWVPGNDGLVIVYEADTRTISFGQDFSRTTEEKDSSRSVPTHEAAIINRSALLGAEDQRAASDAYIQDIVTRLTEGYESYFQKRAVSAQPAQKKRQFLMLLGGLCIVALGALFIMIKRRSAGTLTHRRMEFPPADTPERLGAPCGAAVVSRSFRNTSHGR